MVWVLIAVLAVGCVFLIARHQANKRARLESFVELRKLAANIGSRSHPEPDLGFASDAYSLVAKIRLENPTIGEADLYEAANVGFADILKTATTQQQTLSARWGTIYAINDDLSGYIAGLKAYDDSVAAIGRGPIGGQPDDKFRAAALAHLTLVMGVYPGEYGRFLSSLNAT